ncbi:MAG: anaerobic ribonucleoside-triphosphate reductase activating protein [Oscillospiraceae bacterium]
MEIKLAGTVNDSIVDGPGFRFTVFVQGCPHNCDGCHNPQTHDFGGGTLENTDDILEKITANPLLDGVTFSGGEPFCQAKPLYFLGKEIKKRGYNIIAYTGYLFEYLLENSNNENYYKELISVCDYIVDGKFEKDKKSYLLKFKGSSNQRIIDVKKSFEENNVIEVEL